MVQEPFWGDGKIPGNLKNPNERNKKHNFMDSWPCVMCLTNVDPWASCKRTNDKPPQCIAQIFTSQPLNLQRPKMMEHDADICAVAMAKQKCPVKALEKNRPGQVWNAIMSSKVLYILITITIQNSKQHVFPMGSDGWFLQCWCISFGFELIFPRAHAFQPSLPRSGGNQRAWSESRGSHFLRKTSVQFPN